MGRVVGGGSHRKKLTPRVLCAHGNLSVWVCTRVGVHAGTERGPWRWVGTTNGPGVRGLDQGTRSPRHRFGSRSATVLLKPHLPFTEEGGAPTPSFASQCHPLPLAKEGRLASLHPPGPVGPGVTLSDVRWTGRVSHPGQCLPTSVDRTHPEHPVLIKMFVLQPRTFSRIGPLPRLGRRRHGK